MGRCQFTPYSAEGCIRHTQIRGDAFQRSLLNDLRLLLLKRDIPLRSRCSDHGDIAFSLPYDGIHHP